MYLVSVPQHGRTGKKESPARDKHTRAQQEPAPQHHTRSPVPQQPVGWGYKLPLVCTPAPHPVIMEGHQNDNTFPPSAFLPPLLIIHTPLSPMFK